MGQTETTFRLHRRRLMNQTKQQTGVGSETVWLQCRRNGENDTSVPTTSYCCNPSCTRSLIYSLDVLTPETELQTAVFLFRMSVFDHLAPLIPQVSKSSRQSKEHPSVCLSPPLSISSPVIKKKPIQIPSFDEKGLVCEKHDTNPDRSFVPICSSHPTSSRLSPTKSHQHSQHNHGEKASTLPRTKPKLSSQTLTVKPSISIFPAPQPNSSPTLSPSLEPKPSDSPHPSATLLSDPTQLLHQHTQRPSVSPTLIVPTPRLSPSPTSLCGGVDSPGGRQPSPLAKERRARAINISNTKAESESPNDGSGDILDQEALMNFTHPASRRACSMTRRESVGQTATSQNSCLLRRTSSLSKKEDDEHANYKTKFLTRNADATAIPKLNSNRRQEFLPTASQTSLSESERIKFARVVQRESQPEFDGRVSPSKSSPRRKCTDYSQRRAAGCAANDQSHVQMFAERSVSLPPTPQMSLATEPRLNRSSVSPNIETRRRQFDSKNETKMNSTFLSGLNPRRPQEENNIRTISTKVFQKNSASQSSKFTQKYKFWSRDQSQNTQMDVAGAESKSDCVLKDYSCQSIDIDPKTEAPHCSSRLNQCKTRLAASHSQEALKPGKCSASKTAFSKPDVVSHKQQLNEEQHPGQSKTCKEVKHSDTALTQTDIFAPSDSQRGPAKLPEHPSEKCVVSWPPSVELCPFNTNRSGMDSKGVFDLPTLLQRTVYKSPDETATTTSLPIHRPNYAPADRAFIMEEPEDPYYVTMYYPGSVYVDMSDVVPPEVRPKPVVPAKPPNVGAPSPSSPFPAQGPSIGGGGSGPVHPPSAIPVPIGSHGPSHISSHSVGHGIGHGAGHVAGLTAAHNGGHSGSHSTGGGSTLLGYIGIDTIIEQMRKKTMKTGFDFNIMVVGHSGLGKSTLVNTLFKSQVSRRSGGWSRDEKIPKTVEVKAVSHVLEEGGVKMKLTVVDTPGFGDQINNDNCWEPICKYINEQYEKFLKEEVNITRKKRIPDTRVHCCLYFISPTGHSLRQLDVEFMKRLSHSVNIIPVIAKSDTMTIEERQEFKQRVRKELEMGGIEFYPQKEFDEDMEDKSDNDKIREAMPFAVVGSDKEYQVNGKRVLGRKTAWGIVEVENPNHCEFAQLRDFLIRSHLQDLKEVTHNIHYETYRAKRLNENGGLHPISSNDTQESNL
ncbi:uncharacterized protein V6R79_006166 [Siganus canaliculatus]